MGRAESTRQQDDPALKVLDYYIMGVLNMVPLDDLNKEQLDDCVHALLTSYSEWLCNTNKHSLQRRGSSRQPTIVGATYEFPQVQHAENLPQQSN